MKGFGPKEVCEIAFATVPRQNDSLLCSCFFKKLTQQVPLNTLRLKNFSTSDSTSASDEDVLGDGIPPIQNDENISNKQ